MRKMKLSSIPSKLRHWCAVHVIVTVFGHDCSIQNVSLGRWKNIYHWIESQNHHQKENRKWSLFLVHGEQVISKPAHIRRKQRTLEEEKKDLQVWMFAPQSSQVYQEVSSPSTNPSSTPSQSPSVSSSPTLDPTYYNYDSDRFTISALYQQPDYSDYSAYSGNSDVDQEPTSDNSDQEPLFESGQVTVQVTGESGEPDSGGPDVQTNDETEEDMDLEDTGANTSSVKNMSVTRDHEDDNVVVEIEASSLVTLNTFRIAYAPTEKDGLQTNREAVFVTTAALNKFLNDRFDGVDFEVYATGGIDFVSDNAARRLQRKMSSKTLVVSRSLASDTTGTTYISYGSRATGYNLNPSDLENKIYEMLVDNSMELVNEIRQQRKDGGCVNDKRCGAVLDQIRWINYEKSAPVNLAGESSLGDIGTFSDSSLDEPKSTNSTSLIIGIVVALACLGVLIAFFVRRKVLKDDIETQSVVSNSHLTNAAVGTDATVVSASSGISTCVRFPMGRMNSSQCKTKGPMHRSKGLDTKQTAKGDAESDASFASNDATARSAATVKSKSLRTFRTKKAKPRGGKLFAVRNQALGDDIDCDALTTIQEGDCETSTVNPDDESQIMQERISATTKFTSDFAIEEEDESSEEETENDVSASKAPSFGSHGLLDWFRQTPNKKQSKQQPSEPVVPQSIKDSERYKIINIKAPPGKLGLTVVAPDAECALEEHFSQWCTVETVQAFSPLFGHAMPGDFLVRIDKHDLSGWTPMQISDYIGGKAKEERNLILCRDLSTTGQKKGSVKDTASRHEGHPGQMEDKSTKTTALPSSLRVTSDGDSHDTGTTGACLQLDLDNVIGSFSNI